MPSFMNMETSTSDEQREEKVHNSLDYLISSLKSEEVDEPQVDLTAKATMSTGRSKGTQSSLLFCCTN